jgi:murein peptide amidase A
VSEELIAAVAAASGFTEVGRSALGRPVLGRSFGGHLGGPALVVVGGVHGDEPSSVAAVLEMAAWVEGALLGPLWLLPALNPDGVVARTKNSARDVDLNRNFPAANFRLDHAPGYSPGPAPLSEPETAALAALLASSPISGVVAVHAPFACVNYDGPAQAWAESVASACGWPARADIGYPTPGSLGSWLGRDRGLPVLTLELPPGPYEGFRREAQAALRAAVENTPKSPLQTATNPQRIR